MTLSNQDIVARASELAARSDALTRRASLCVAVACREHSTIAAARKLLERADPPDVRQAALRLLDELAGGGTDAGADGQLHD